MSSESWDGQYMAAFYSREGILALDRDQRIAHMEAKLAELEAADRDEFERHKRECPKCQAGEFCSYRFSISPAESERRDLQSRLRRYIHMERCDAEYAAGARVKTVDYRDHIDGFCSYWQNLRWRRFYFAGLKCEACGDGGSLECHHVDPDYGTLGFEELDDVRALCPSCHKASHHRSA